MRIQMHGQARAANPLYLLKYLVKHPGALHCIVTVFLAEMVFLLVNWVLISLTQVLVKKI